MCLTRGGPQGGPAYGLDHRGRNAQTSIPGNVADG